MLLSSFWQLLKCFKGQFCLISPCHLVESCPLQQLLKLSNEKMVGFFVCTLCKQYLMLGLKYHVCWNDLKVTWNLLNISSFDIDVNTYFYIFIHFKFLSVDLYYNTSYPESNFRHNVKQLTFNWIANAFLFLEAFKLD